MIRATDTVITVKQVVQVRLLPTPKQAAALTDTLHACNRAASWLSKQMHAARVVRKFDVQKRFYAELRRRFGLAAQPTIRRKRSRKEARFAADVNHQISKSIVAEAERSGRGIAVEELTGIRERVRLRKPQRATLHSWAFAQLGGFLAYKARRAGVVLVQVDPAYTSQTCHVCGHVDRRNRRRRRSARSFRPGRAHDADSNSWAAWAGCSTAASLFIRQRGVGEVKIRRPTARPAQPASSAVRA